MHRPAAAPETAPYRPLEQEPPTPLRVGSIRRLATILLAAGLFAASPSTTRAQDGADAALEELLKEVGEEGKTGDSKPPEQAPKTDDPKPLEADPGKPKPPDAPEPTTPAPEELTGEDKEVDDLLRSLGESVDEPETKEEKKPPGREGEDRDPSPEADRNDQNRPRDPGEAGRSRLDEEDRAIDEELEALTGRRRKQKDQDDGQGSGPMGEIVKEMREIQERLGEPDTGEGTRGRQQQLVKRMDALIEQIRKQQQQQRQGGRMQQQTRQDGRKPGQEEGSQAGDDPGGAPNQRPLKPTDKRSLANGKDAWGHLPPELRQEMENVAKEDSLPASEDLIRRYYLSVSRGKLNRGE